MSREAFLSLQPRQIISTHSMTRRPLLIFLARRWNDWKAVERCETYSFTLLNDYDLFYPSWKRYKFQSLHAFSKANETLLTVGAESSLRIFLPFLFFFPFKIPFSLIYNEIIIYHVTVSYG